MDKDVLNEPTSKMIMKNLMENGLRNPGGDNLGKTIVFARNHEHAKMLIEYLTNFIHSMEK